MVAVADYAWMDGALQFAPSQSLSPALRPALRPRARHLLPCHYTSPTARRERDSERERERESFFFPLCRRCRRRRRRDFAFWDRKSRNV